MKRKINRVGVNTLTVSLPSKWVQKFGLKAGDEVDIEEDAGFLGIYPPSYSKLHKLTNLNLSKKSTRYIRSHIGRLYRYGASTINVAFDDPETFKKIKEATDNLIGADIIDVDNKKCVIKVFPIEESIEDFDKYLVKIIVTLKYMFTIVREDIQKNTFENENALNELRNNNWKLKDFILRTAFLMKIPHEEYNILSHLLFSYEKIGTNILQFYRLYLEGSKKKINANKLKLAFDKTESFFDWFKENISKKKPISESDETEFRKELRDFHGILLNKFHSDKEIDNAILTIIYFIHELLDSTVSYLSFYKTQYQEKKIY